MAKKLRKLKLTPLTLIILVILILDWAALDDITTGTEPYKWEEWDFILISLIIFGLIIYSKRDKIQKWIINK